LIWNLIISIDFLTYYITLLKKTLKNKIPKKKKIPLYK
jgi:hypothetical protein